jgi:hypothetical protein
MHKKVTIGCRSQPVTFNYIKVIIKLAYYVTYWNRHF